MMKFYDALQLDPSILKRKIAACDTKKGKNILLDRHCGALGADRRVCHCVYQPAVPGVRRRQHPTKKQIVANEIHNYTPPEEYIPPRSPAVQEHLEWFMGLKLGFMMHWAPGSQLGTYESWPLSDGDAAWS